MRKVLCIIILLLALSHTAYSETIGQIKSLPLGVPVVVSGIVTWVKGFDCYVQSEDRSAGIWVQGNTIGVYMGDKVTVTGNLAMDSYELVISEAAIYPTGQAGLIAPFAMSNKAVVGAYAFQQFRVQDRVSYKIPGDGTGQRWDYAGGASNVAMLVKTWGTVKSTYYSAESDQKWFYVDDGSNATADFGDMGILVYSSADVNQGDVVSVTGVSSVELAFDQPDKLIRVLRPRNAGDVEVLKSYEPQLGFSDEFNGAAIDPRWSVIPSLDSFFVESGSLVATPKPGAYNLCQRTTLAQVLPENYDLDMKVQLGFSNDPFYQNQLLALAMSTVPDNRYCSTRTVPPSFAFSVNRSKGLGDIIFIGYPDQQDYMTLPSTNFLFHMSKRGNATVARISYDGINYSNDYVVTGMPLLLISAQADLTTSASQPADQFKAYIDYIRITPVSE